MNTLTQIFLILLFAPLASNAMMQLTQRDESVKLPKELHAKILAKVIKSSVLPQNATQAIRAWAHANHHCYQMVNSEYVTKSLLSNLNWLKMKTKMEYACELRTPGAGQWLANFLQKGDANQSEQAFNEHFLSAISFGDRRLPLFMIAHVKANPKFITAALARVTIDSKIRCRDNSVIIQKLQAVQISQEL